MHACPSGTSRTRQVAAAVIGNALEWYDFIVYGFLSSLIARLFFPSGDEYTSLLMALATFGVGFFMRPVGGVLLGLYADRRSASTSCGFPAPASATAWPMASARFPGTCRTTTRWSR